MGQGTCNKHPSVSAKWWCQTCQELWCDACAGGIATGEAQRRICPQCGCRVNPLRAAVSVPAIARGAPQAPTRPKAFFPELVGAFAYPFKGNGPWLVIGWTVFVLVSDAASYFCGFAGLLGLLGLGLIWVFLTGYLCAYVIKALVSSAGGEDELPELVRFSSWWDDILHPILLLAGTVAVFLLPAAAYYLVNISADSAGTAIYTGSGPILVLLLGVGSFLLPMGLLSVAMYDSFRGLNPLRIFLSIARVPGPYTIAWVLILLVAALRRVVSAHLGGIFIISSLVQAPAGFYFLIVEMRIIGLIYAAYSRRLNWFDEASDRRGKPRT